MPKITVRYLAKKFAQKMVGTCDRDANFLRFRDGFLAVVTSETDADRVALFGEASEGQTEIGISRGGEVFCVLHRGSGDLNELIGLFNDGPVAGQYEAVDYRETEESTIKKFAASLGILDD